MTVRVENLRDGNCVVCGREVSRGMFCVEHRQFQVLTNTRAEREVGFPLTVPFSAVAAHRKQIERNHGQTLERLAERGGLAPEELWCGFHGKSISLIIYSVGNELPSAERLAEWLRGICASGNG